MSRPRTAAFHAALSEVGRLVRETVPSERRPEVKAAITRLTIAAVRDDRTRRPQLAHESRAVFDEIFGNGGVFERIFGKTGGGR